MILLPQFTEQSLYLCMYLKLKEEYLALLYYVWYVCRDTTL